MLAEETGLLGIKRFDVSKEIARGAAVAIGFAPDAAGECPILRTGFCGDEREAMKHEGVMVVRAREAEAKEH